MKNYLREYSNRHAYVIRKVGKSSYYFMLLLAVFAAGSISGFVAYNIFNLPPAISRIYNLVLYGGLVWIFNYKHLYEVAKSMR